MVKLIKVREGPKLIIEPPIFRQNIFLWVTENSDKTDERVVTFIEIKYFAKLYGTISLLSLLSCNSELNVI